MMAGPPAWRDRGRKSSRKSEAVYGAQDEWAIRAALRWADPVLGGGARGSTDPQHPGPPCLGCF